SLNGVKISGTKVYRQKLKESEPACSSIERYSQMGATYYTAAALIGKTNDEKKLPCASLIIFKETPTKSCVYGPAVSNSTDNFAKQYCKVSYKNEEIFVDRSKIGISKPVCAEEEPKKEETAPPKKQTQSVVDCPAVLPIKNSKSHEKHPLPVCYTYENGEYTVKGKDVKEMFTCSKGYRRIIEESLEQNTCSKLKNTKEQQTCYKTFIYSCLSISKPKVSGTGSAATPEQLGTLSIKGYDSDTNTGLEGYIINNGSKPTVNPDEWTEFPNLEYEDTKTMTSGSYFIWTMTNDNSISYPILLTIKDDDISTTVSDIKISSSNGAINHSYNPIQSDDSTAYNQEVSSSNYVRLSNQLADKSVVASGFDLFKTAYELNVDSNQIAIYATLTNKDSNYVEGYEPRTVDLDYGRNVVLIKIVNKNNKERTYTFIINRSDNRESINTLKSLTTSLGNLNFDPHISDYTISVPKNAKSVNINGTLDSSKSSFIKGYEPRRIDLTNDITSAALKTISEAGIARNYILTFIKTGASISNDISKSTYLSSLTIPGTEIIFDRDTLNYTVSTPYEIQNLPVFALPESENATVEINGNQDLKVGANRVEIIITNDNLMKIYTIFINRKEDGLEISSNTKLETLTIKDYDLKFIEDVYDYTVKIKREKTLLLSATPQSDRAEVYMYGNNDLTTFSTIRVKVIAENGDTGLYSIDIIKDIYNKKFETTVAIIASMILLSGTIIVIINKKRKKLKDYIEG
ncbi:MAG: cadherin-like beta sandwich domain-containing protein, partial [Bacilli bacterium]|nr:cadherin-like beta sandwich domain-containing protein [Bacilli bacterium]